jgi:alpha-galactosidase
MVLIAGSTCWAAAEPSPDLKAAQPPAGAIWLETLDMRLVTQDTGVAQAGTSSAERPITIAGAVYPHGVGAHAPSEMKIDLGGGAVRFLAMVGVDDEAQKHGSVTFEAWLDGRKVQDSGPLRGGEPAKLFSADLTGGKTLSLLVTDAGDGTDWDHADWAGAIIMLVPGATARPRTLMTDAEMPILPMASGSPDRPRINGPRVVGTTPGRAFIFRVPATGKEPLVFAAQGLPKGLELDPQTGIITGSIPRDGSADIPESKHVVTLNVQGPAGEDSRTLTIVAGKRKLAMTPPMGWNSWNVWGCAVDDAKIRAAADAMVSSGLAAHGFSYINIDDCWQAGRDANGEIQANEKFPDMKALGDYIHSKGLRFGIYSSPGPKTCGGYTASYQHEQQDARTWAKWGVDYVKYDWCSYADLARPLFDNAKAQSGSSKAKLAMLNLDIYQAPYRVIREALDGCDRDIVLSLCQYGMGDVWTWGGEIGGNLWRTTGDINDSWQSMTEIGFDQNKASLYAGPGRWNDPDMLVVGKVGWGPKLRDSKLTRHEQITHITLWGLLSAPLLIGCDMPQMDQLTLDLLSNDEVLAVNQDSLGKAATRKAQQGVAEVWARPLEDGTLAVGLFNRGLKRLWVTAEWSDLGLKGTQPVRDLWQQKDLGAFTDRFKVEIPRHGAVLLKVGGPAGKE